MYDNLRAVMAAKGITIEAMAKLLNLARRTVQNKLCGESEFTYGEAQQISEIMFPEYTMKYLFHRAQAA